MNDNILSGKRIGLFARHLAFLLPIVIITLVINRNLILSADPPAGVDMLGWINASSYLAGNFDKIWLDYSFGVSGSLSPSYLLFAAANVVIQNPTVTVKLSIFALVFVAGLSAYMLIYHYTRNKFAGLIAAIVFILNPVYIGVIGSGQLNSAFVLTLGPLLFLTFDKALDTHKFGALAAFAFVTTA